MIRLSEEIETLALRLAAAQRAPVEAVIQHALENEARATGLALAPGSRRRMSVDQILAVGREIAALPLLDRRPASQIMDELNAL